MSAMTLRVMSANLRFRVPSTTPGDPDHWDDRLPAAIEILRQQRPALIGTQEGTFPQLRELLEALPAYGLVGTGREGGSRGEYSAILYDTSVLELEAWDQWWLSETPEVIASRSWDTDCTRIATSARFVHRATGKGFVNINTHLDHRSELARVKGAELILQRLAAGPTLVTGDFNCAAGRAEAWQRFIDAGLADTWLTADHRGVEVDTFNGYADPAASDPPVRIDWILATPDWKATSAAIVTDRPAGVWSSDHWPIVADLTLS